MRFSKKSVVITGAASGIGAHLARRFADEGAQVVVADIDTDGATRVAEAIGARAVTVDITDPESVRSMINSASEDGGTVDVLINNAMVCGTKPFLEAEVEDVRTDLEVNLLGPFLCCRAVLPTMIDNGGGVIINMASVNGLGHFGNEAYSAAKAGVISLTRSIAAEFGDRGVRCCAVAPGTVRTEAWQERIDANPEVLDEAAAHYPLGRIGSVDDVAEALLFLASPQASWISGITLPIEGGLLTGNRAMARQIATPD